MAAYELPGEGDRLTRSSPWVRASWFGGNKPLSGSGLDYLRDFGAEEVFDGFATGKHFHRAIGFEPELGGAADGIVIGGHGVAVSAAVANGDEVASGGAREGAWGEEFSVIAGEDVATFAEGTGDDDGEAIGVGGCFEADDFDAVVATVHGWAD